ncbi:hypothetical protein ACFVAJ_07655 [Agromyces sp. NPDC057679]|uniref:hypothetical protein n=1 Tax=Agromyces sp. NPDC057679 TaxID=3346207 RepID=UPI00366B318F
MSSTAQRAASGSPRRGRFAAFVLATVATCLTAGCATAGAAQAPTTAATAPTSTAATSDPIGLIGMWRVSDAAGEGPDTWLRLDAPEFSLWRDCGMIGGGWLAGERTFLAQTMSASDDCANGGFPTIAWLDETTSYRAADDGWQLLDAEGEPVASLAIDGAPDPIDTVADFFAEPPVIDDAVRAFFADAAPLPDTLAAAGADDLLGRWEPAGASYASDPHVVFLAAGEWTGSDGCNGQSGRWAVDGDGELLVISGASTLIGCDGAPAPGWVAGARRAAFDDEELVLLDREGAELGRLVRAGG